MNVSTRPESEADAPFIRRLIFDTISEELCAAAWPEPMRSHLIEIQYRGRRHSGGEMILADEANAGWMVVSETADELRIVEIMISAERRGAGLGSAAIRSVMQRARGRPVTLDVMVSNARAIRLYQRLGFQIVHSDEIRHLMRWI